MILGIGHDIVDIRRIEKTLSRFGARFITRCFTEKEQELAESRAHTPQQRIATYAKRFAAKEACVKAMGSGVADGVALKDIEIVKDRKGRPMVNITGGAYRYIALRVPDETVIVVHMSLTDEPPYASAYAIIEACHPSPEEPMMSTITH